MLRVGIVANEASGDILGAALAREIRRRLPDARFVGVAGPRMQEAGCETLFAMERLSVMGLMEVLRHLRELLGLRRELVRYFIENPPDVFIGVDAPDFNLGLERRLRRAGIRTVHMVSPTVWAWRPGRVKTIRRSVDLMLSVFPFEEPSCAGTAFRPAMSAIRSPTRSPWRSIGLRPEAPSAYRRSDPSSPCCRAVGWARSSV
jgi:lipid-A-disaccharide synthase